MKRSLGYSTLLLIFAAAAPACGQSSASASLAQRVGNLREGWSREAEPTPSPAVVANNKAPASPGITQPGRAAASVSDTPRSFPRVNPRDLLPRNWFGVGERAAPKTVERAKPAAVATDRAPTVEELTRDSGGAAGSARARLWRDLRREKEGPRVDVAEVSGGRRPAPRAGSALSPNPPAVIASDAAAIAKNSRLARSIAEEVADAMIADADDKPQKDEPEAAEAVVAADDSADAADTSGESILPFGGDLPTDLAPVTEPVLAPVAEVEPPAAPEASAEPKQAKAVEPIVAETESGRIRVAEKASSPNTKLPLVIGEESPAAKGAFAGRAPSTVGPVTARRQASRTPLVVAPSAPQSPAADDDLLLTQKTPLLVSRVSGPRTIVVGREVLYRVAVANRGEVGADQVVTNIRVPEWADVVSADAMKGVIEGVGGANTGGELVWRNDHLGAGAIARLDLRLVARSGRPIELGVTHTHQPVGGQTLVEVQEPKLALSLVGPAEVLFGKSQTYQLTISNPGTGAAENVKLHLTPPGGDTTRRTSHSFGVLPPGDQRTVDIELTARQAGRLAVNASAEADGDVTADVTKDVFCRKPELVVDWRGPSERYAGAAGVYYFRVRNPGTAIANDVRLDVQLPEGFEVQRDAKTPAPVGRKIVFTAGELRPGDDRYFELRGVHRAAGANTLACTARDSGETRSETLEAVVEVIALADLKLDVVDPQGPVATGSEVAYEIRVKNRGSNDAHDVRVVGFFSDGIDPHHVDGGGSDIHDGRVAFESIDRIAPGEERVFTIHARAHEEGTHVFRAEVICRDLEIKLAAVETTRFYEDESLGMVGEGYSIGGRTPNSVAR